MKKQWNELKAIITELRDNGGTGEQKEVCKFLVNLMDKLEEQASSSEEPNKWIPLTKRPLTVKECGEYVEGRTFTETMLLNCPLPKDGQWVLISHSDGYVHTDIFHNDEGACYFEGFDIDEVEAWKPAEPYKESEDKND